MLAVKGVCLFVVFENGGSQRLMFLGVVAVDLKTLMDIKAQT